MNIVLFAAALTALQSAPFESDVELALGTVGLSGKTAVFDEGMLKLFRYGEFTSPFYDACLENPWRTPFLADSVRREIASQAGRPSDTLNSGGRLVGFGTRRTLIGNPNAAQEAEAKKPGAMAAVLAQMAKDQKLAGPVPDLASVPAEVKQAAALILSVLPRALEYRRVGTAGLGDLPAAYRKLAAPNSNGGQGAEFDAVRRLYRGVELRDLAAGAHDVLLAVQAATTILATVPASARYDVEVPTVWGVIRLTGGGDTRHPARPTLLIIDTGGDDLYLGAPTNAGPFNWCSVVIDTGGNDRYLSDPALETTPLAQFAGRKEGRLTPGPGGALLGYAILFDLAGDDLYRSHLPGIGSGRLGVGVVFDREGKDEYDGYQDAQGFGMFGAGILEDGAGDDRYRGFTQVQGIGQTAGFGLLVDRSGQDVYEANDTDIDFPSPQSAEHNVSMSQGAGNGRRGDYLDGHSLAGGVGVLFDQAGDDLYTCGVFGQGVGYWMGVGMLWDDEGNDRYSGQWYVHGAAAHFAVGYLEDGKGDDRYTSPMNMAQGAGHDFSLGVLIDRAGNDRYSAPNLSLGAGNANGIGWFVDFGGDDTYESSGITLGRAAEAAKGTLRSRALCLGVFMDLGGQDTYPGAATWAKNGARTANWTDKGPTSSESQVGVFWDR